MEGKSDGRTAIYWICVLALFIAGMANAVRGGAAGTMTTALLDLAAATCVWRDLFASPVEVYTKGLAYIRSCSSELA